MSIQIRVEPGVEGVTADHSAYAQAAEEFRDDVGGQSGLMVKEVDSDQRPSSAKGAMQHLFLFPESASAAWAAVKIMKLWLSRDRRRTIDVSISRPGGDPLTVHASGDPLSLETLDNAIRQALKAK